jgi:hypothetical protein
VLRWPGTGRNCRPLAWTRRRAGRLCGDDSIVRDLRWPWRLSSKWFAGISKVHAASGHPGSRLASRRRSAVAVIPEGAAGHEVTGVQIAIARREASVRPVTRR